MKRTFNVIVFLVFACMAMQLTTQVKAQNSVTETIQLFLQDMWRDYTDFYRCSNHIEKLDVAKRMALTASTILAYYQGGAKTETDTTTTAEALMLLSLVAYEVNNPTLTYHSLEIADSLDRSVFEKKDPMTGKPFKERIALIKKNWLSNFKRSSARVYGFNNRITWDTLRVEIGVTYLERNLREDKIFRAIEGAEGYLNSELRNGKKEIILLLPPGMYRLETDNLDIYPADFEVEENSPPAIFDITPDRYFHLRVFYCKDTTLTRIDTIFNEAKIGTMFLEETSQVYQERPKRYQNYLFAEVDTTFKVVKTITVETQKIPLSPKDIDIWKGDRKVLNFDRLAFGEYEFSDGKKFGLPDEFKFKRFLPEDLKWDIPFEDKFSGEEIHVKSGDPFQLCVDLPRKTRRVIEGEEVISQNGKGPSGPWPPFFYTTFMAAIFYIFMNTIK